MHEKEGIGSGIVTTRRNDANNFGLLLKQRSTKALVSIILVEQESNIWMQRVKLWVQEDIALSGNLPECNCFSRGDRSLSDRIDIIINLHTSFISSNKSLFSLSSTTFIQLVRVMFSRISP
mmetsp:Transcript_26896/g.40387  ORF Transcript_26896/g.40387 Transcript_26896/m.40387 type:complete len:121 (-) Transcript_26896:289-651(-)